MRDIESFIVRRYRSGTQPAHLGGCVILQGAPSSIYWDVQLLRAPPSNLVAFMIQFPILKSTHHLLPSPDGELAPAIEAILDIYGVNVTVIVSHNGQGS